MARAGSHRQLHAWFALILVLALAALYADLLSGQDGRTIVQGVEGAVRAWLVSVPVVQRGAWWRCLEFCTSLCLTGPLYVASAGRANFFDTLFEVNGGKAAPFVHGIAHSSHHLVATAIRHGVEQPSQPLMGGSAVVPRCLGNNTLLFVGSNTEHVRIRAFLADHLHQEYSARQGLRAASTDKLSANHVRRSVIRELFNIMWGAAPSAETEDNMLEYLTWGSLCFFGEHINIVNIATGGHALRQLDRIRGEVASAVAKTPRGTSLVEAATAEFGGNNGVLDAVVDGMLFVGIRGTVHMVEAILERISDSHAMVPLWTADPRSFVLEHVRLDPPVLTSISSVMPEPSNITVGAGSYGQRIIRLEAGSVVQLVLSQANRDPTVFGGPLRLPSRARVFDPTRGAREFEQVLTFNNVLNARDGEASGPGYGLSVDLTVALVDYFLPLGGPQEQTNVEEASFLRIVDYARNQSATAVERWLHVTNIDLFADIFSRESLLDDVGNAVWAMCCLCGIYSMSKGPKSQPPAELMLRLGEAKAKVAWHKRPCLVGRHYEFYLLAQSGVAIGALLRRDLLQNIMKAAAASSYAALALRVDEFFQCIDEWDLEHSGRSMKDSVGAQHLSRATSAAVTGPRAMWLKLGSNVRKAYIEECFAYEYASLQPGYIPLVYTMLLITVLLVLGHIYAPNSFYGQQSIVIYVVYAPACLAAWLSIWRFLWRCDDQSAIRTWKLGIIGGFFGIVNLVWPCIFPPHLYHLVSRTADSILYVPLVLSAVSKMDDEMWAAVPWTQTRDDRLAKGLMVGARPLMWVMFAVVLSCQSFESWLPFLPEIAHSLGAASTLELCHNAVDEAAHPAACANGTAYLRAVDGHTRVVFGLFQALDFAAMDDLAPSVVAPSIYFGSISAHKPHTALLPNSGFGIAIPSFDISDDAELSYCDRRYQSCDSTGVILDFQARYAPFHALRMYSLVDLAEPWEEPQAVGAEIVQAVAQRSLAPLVLRTWTEMSSDMAISQWAFAGLAAHAVKVHTGGKTVAGVAVAYEVNYEWMHMFNVREGFERYGATAYFGADRAVLMIHWADGNVDSMPGDEHWEHAKWVWKCSALVGVTLKDHLVGIHFEQANDLYKNTVEQLPAAHPLRRLLLPHIYATPSINSGAAITLATEFGILHHAVALEWQALREAFVASRKALRAEPLWLDEHLQQRGMGNGDTDEDLMFYPWGYEMRQFTSTIESMVSAYMHEYYPDDASVAADLHLRSFVAAFPPHYHERISKDGVFTKQHVVDLLATVITYVTGFHNHLGNIADYVRSPLFVSPKIRPGMEVSDQQATFQALNVALATALKAPPLLCARQQLPPDCYTHILLKDEHSEATSKILTDFQIAMMTLTEEMERRNEKRGGYACNSFNPTSMTSSVSI